MKQCINIEQWKELTKEEDEFYYKYITEKYPFQRSGVYVIGIGIGYTLTIGQMIEFLDDNKDKDSFIPLAMDKGEHEWYIYSISKQPSHRATELCDALWLAFKHCIATKLDPPIKIK